MNACITTCVSPRRTCTTAPASSLNSTLKMVRGRIVEKYRDRLEFLYSPRGKDIISEQNLSVVRAWSKVSEPGRSA